MCIYGVQVPCAGRCHAESTTVLDTESQRALDRVGKNHDLKKIKKNQIFLI